MTNNTLSRRNFIRFATLGLGGLGFNLKRPFYILPDFPTYERLGRVCVGMVEIKEQPDEDSQSLGVLYEDAVIPWLRELAGRKPLYINQRWVETTDGFIYSPYIQPVRNLPNQSIDRLFQLSMGEGMWFEVTVPYADVILENSPSSHSWVSARIDQGLPVRIYYGQVFFVDRIQIDDNSQVWYKANPNYYGGLDQLWVPAEAMRPISPDEISPIHPNTAEKRIEVDLTRQTLACFEENVEVFFCRISSGAKYDAYGNPVDTWSTPVGRHQISRKFISLQMSGGTTGAGYDLPGIGWTNIFVTGGVAIHATVWHNDFGTPRSHGCVNCRPEDAKWIFRWTQPVVAYDPGMVDISSSGETSTIVEVIES
jgi:lipoprotein-anchoring transpeptidase ErfK/SrfK